MPAPERPLAGRRTWRVGTRGSRLALAQTEGVIERLRREHPGARFEVVVVRTTGDADQSRDLAQFGSVGVFVREIERALLRGAIDLAVHSAKDLPTLPVDGLTLAAFPPRGPVHDVIICRGPVGVDPATGMPALPEGARVGTASVRRRAQLLAWRPDLRPESLRGNVDTRLARLARGDVDALVLAAAGLERLGLLPGGRVPPPGEPVALPGLEPLHALALPLDHFVPAPGQGALALQVRAGDEPAAELARAVDHPATSLAVRAERAFLSGMGSSCAVPIGACGWIEGEELHLMTYYAGAVPTHRLWSGAARLPEDVGLRAARAVLPGNARG